MKNRWKWVVASAMLVLSISVGSAETAPNLTGLIEAFKTGSHDEIVSHLVFPIQRRYPLSMIENAKFALDHFDEIFDSVLMARIANSTAVDWQQVGWRGWCLGAGDVWVTMQGQISAINYQTKQEAGEWQRLVDIERESLPADLRTFDFPISLWKTKNYVVRVDDVAGKARLAVWKIGDQTKPEIVLQAAAMANYGTIGTYTLEWEDGDLVYRVEENQAVEGKAPSFQIFKKDDLESNREAAPWVSEMSVPLVP